MLRCVALASLKFGEVLNDSLHVFDGVELSLALLRLEEGLDEGLDLCVQFTVVRMDHFPEEGVVD